MRFSLRQLLCWFVFALFTLPGLGQNKTQEIELLHADRFLKDDKTPEGASKLRGNVRLKHQNALMFCDSALLYDNNSLRAQGHVKIIESDSLTLKGDSLFYNGNTKLAKFRGHVIIDNGSSILKTNFLDYNRETNTGHYYNGGVIDSEKEKIHLVSKRGYFYNDANLFHFKTDVVMDHPEYIIYTDTMHYSSKLEKTWFYGPTRIEFKEDKRKIFCELGWFDQLADQASFIRNARILSSGQDMRGDTIEYDEKAKIGISRSNVVLIDTSEKFEVNGDYAIHYEADSVSYVTKNMLLKQDMSGDTFFLVGDSLHTYIDTGSHKRVLKTYHHVRFYKSDMQGRCDSLVYHTADSIILMFHDPVIWTDENQLTADSISMVLRNGDIDRMFMNRNGFIIASDSNLFNQIKGRKMIGFFRKSSLHKVDVFGNGQTIYYPREEDQSIIGVNETKCSNMSIRVDSNQIEKISFYDRPTAKLTPSDDMPAGGLSLDGFAWRVNERPGSVTDLQNGTSTPVLPRAKRKPSALVPPAVADSTINADQEVQSEPEVQAPTDMPAEQNDSGAGAGSSEAPAAGEVPKTEAMPPDAPSKTGKLNQKSRKGVKEP